MSLRVVHKNSKIIRKDVDQALKEREKQLMDEIKELFRRRAYKKHGLPYPGDHKNIETA